MLDKRLVIIEDPIKEVFRIGAPINDKRITTRAKYRGRDRKVAITAIQEKNSKLIDMLMLTFCQVQFNV